MSEQKIKNDIDKIREKATSFIQEVERLYRNSSYKLIRSGGENTIYFLKILPNFAWDIYSDKEQSYVYKIIASIYSYNPCCRNIKKSFGDSCAEYKRIASTSFEDEFFRIIKCPDRRSIFESKFLSKITKLLSKENIKIDYIELFVDLWFWGDKIGEKWFRDFVGAKEKNND